MNLPVPVMSGKVIGLGSAAGIVIIMQLLLFGAFLDLASDFILFGLAYAVGRFSK